MKYIVPSNDEVIEYNSYRKTLGYPPLSVEEIQKEFNVSSFYDDPLNWSAQRYSIIDNELVYNYNWKDDLKNT